MIISTADNTIAVKEGKSSAKEYDGEYMTYSKEIDWLVYLLDIGQHNVKQSFPTSF